MLFKIYHSGQKVIYGKIPFWGKKDIFIKKSLGKKNVIEKIPFRLEILLLQCTI